MTIGRRLSLSAAVAVAVAVALASVASYVAVRSKMRGEVDNSLRDRAAAVTRFAREDPGGPEGRRGGEAGGPGGADAGGGPGGADAGGGPGGAPPPGGPPPGVPTRDGSAPGTPGGDDARRPPRGPLPPPPSGRFGGAEGYVQFVRADGTAYAPRGQSGTALPVDDRTRGVASGGSEEFLADRDVDGEHLRVLTAPVESGEAVQVARPLAEVDSVLRSLTAIFATFTLIGVALATGLGAIVTRAALAPVRRFTERTESVARERDVGRRLPEGEDDELGRLARTFNSTLDELERSVTAQRQLVADASHELRTPLASLRTNIELLQSGREIPERDHRELMDDVREEIDELTRLVSDVVELARRGESEADRDEVALDEIVAAAVERARRRAPATIFDTRLEPALVHGAPDRLDRAVTNLLDNAAKWGGDGRVEVHLTGAGELTVRDHGPGFEEADLPHVFDRFYRARAARGMRGSGLGLAIVRQTAESHGGTVGAENAPGGGALLRLRLPVADAPERARDGSGWPESQPGT
ncbi:MAG TPA: HAMP domain-containing sensor histidine kinase [Thermoleophilaceae bacterium]